MRRISIIGSGFCGTALAIQLLRRAKQPLHLHLINRSGQLARGLAYGTRSASHILNVPAERMSLFADQPGDFLAFARQQLPKAQPGSFLPRRLYGDYLQQRLQEAIRGKHAAVMFDSIQAQVIDLAHTAGGLTLRLDDGEELASDQAVIATGNFTPTTPKPLAAIARDARYVRDPWQSGVLDRIAPDARVLLVGTGLTMYDMALALQDKGHRAPVYALSRRALQPHGHRDNAQHPALPELPEAFRHASRIRQLLAEVRSFVASATADGFDWRDVVAALRPITPALWQQLDTSERKRFLRHLQPYWEVHRHRAAPSIATRIDGLRQQGLLRVLAGRIVCASSEANAILLGMRARGQEAPITLSVDHIINCTGPCNDLSHLDEPLFSALHARQELCQDASRIGLEVDEAYRLLDSHQRPHPRLYLLSPMLRARYWESTAVPELRQHAENLARILLNEEGLASTHGIAPDGR